MMLLRHHLVGDHTTLEVMQEEMQAFLWGERKDGGTTAVPEFSSAGAGGSEPGRA